MTAILERLKADFAAEPRRDITIQLKDGPLMITWTALSARDHERIYAPTSDGKPPAGGLVRLRAVMIKACDENGRLAFDGMDEHALRHEVGGDRIGEIANAILFDAGVVDKAGAAISADDQVDAAKND